MAKYIYSTMSADNKVAIYKKNAEGKQVVNGAITIKGKSNIMDKKLLMTPKGALTTLEDKEYDLIKDNTHFKKWIEKGFIKVESKKVNADEVAKKDMTAKDKSAQKTKDDYSKSVKAKVVVEEK